MEKDNDSKLEGRIPLMENNDYEFANEGGIQQLTLDSILIDWNGAQLKNGSTLKATLNTTGQLLSYMSTISDNNKFRKYIT